MTQTFESYRESTNVPSSPHGNGNNEETVWFDLVIRCPACIKEEREPGPEGQWYHAADDGKIQVGNNAEYRCRRCEHHSHVKDWRYACERHATEYRPTTAAALANALSVAGQITSTGGRRWMQQFLENLGEW